MPTFYRCSVNDIETGDVTFIDFNTQYVRDFVFSDIPYNIASSESDYNSFLADTELLTNIDEIASDNNKFYASGYIANISYDYLNSKNVPILILQRASNYEDYYVHYYDGEKTYSYFQHDSWNSFVNFSRRRRNNRKSK